MKKFIPILICVFIFSACQKSKQMIVEDLIEAKNCFEKEIFEETVYEHLLIPELKLAFMSSDFLNRNKYENSSDINFTRFYDHSILSKKKNRLSFDKKIISEIVDSASEEINTALTVHNELEKYFIESLEINKIEKFSENFIKKIL